MSDIIGKDVYNVLFYSLVATITFIGYAELLRVGIDSSIDIACYVFNKYKLRNNSKTNVTGYPYKLQAKKYFNSIVTFFNKNESLVRFVGGCFIGTIVGLMVFSFIKKSFSTEMSSIKLLLIEQSRQLNELVKSHNRQSRQLDTLVISVDSVKSFNKIVMETIKKGWIVEKSSSSSNTFYVEPQNKFNSRLNEYCYSFNLQPPPDCWL